LRLICWKRLLGFLVMYLFFHFFPPTRFVAHETASAHPTIPLWEFTKSAKTVSVGSRVNEPSAPVNILKPDVAYLQFTAGYVTLASNSVTQSSRDSHSNVDVVSTHNAATLTTETHLLLVIE